jgi:carotenoid cleavage dioxygenase
MEGEVQALEVHGSIPKEIDGTFYRVMPDPQLPPFVQDDPVSTLYTTSDHRLHAN